MSDGDPSRTERVVVIGAGVMGHGIAQVAAMAGYETVLCDANPDVLARAMSRVEGHLAKGVDRGKVTEAVRQRALAALSTSPHHVEAVADAHWIIEAIPEDMALKKALFAELSGEAPPSAVLATNTSSLSVTELASAVDHPERVIGLHFFNPVHIVRLLEIVVAVRTSDDTVQRARALADRLGKAIVEVRDSPGFATSRLGLVLGLEAIRMVEAGVASAEDIDRAMELGYRHPMGPLRLTDLVGLDTRLAIAETLHRELGGEQFRPPVLLRQMVRAGKLGRKSGEGFYVWDEG